MLVNHRCKLIGPAFDNVFYVDNSKGLSRLLGESPPFPFHKSAPFVCLLVPLRCFASSLSLLSRSPCVQCGSNATLEDALSRRNVHNIKFGAV